MRESKRDVVKRLHPLAWVWEPLETEPSFVLRAMFGAKAVYLGGKLMFCVIAKEEPWQGLLVCTSREHHAALVAQFAELSPHPVLPKWLYLSESAATFERTANRLVVLARQRDPRLGILPKGKKSKRRHPAPERPAPTPRSRPAARKAKR